MRSVEDNISSDRFLNPHAGQVASGLARGRFFFFFLGCYPALSGLSEGGRLGLFDSFQRAELASLSCLAFEDPRVFSPRWQSYFLLPAHALSLSRSLCRLFVFCHPRNFYSGFFFFGLIPGY